MSLRFKAESPKSKRLVLNDRECRVFNACTEEKLTTPSQGGKDRAAHSRFRGAFASPDFPLRDALREKHLHPGDRSNPFLRGNLQELRPLGTVDKVHDDATL